MYMKQKGRKIGELKVYCLNKQLGCTEVLKYDDCISHLSTGNNGGCLYTKLDCPNKCGTKVFRGKMLEHRQKLCPKRIVACIHCDLEGEYEKVIVHVIKCTMRPVPCPQGCGVQILPKNLQAHKNECPLDLVACSFSEFGCIAKLQRKNMKQHVESTDHTSMMAKSLVAFRERVKLLEQQNATLTESHQALQSKFSALVSLHFDLKDCHGLLQEEYQTLKMEHKQFKEEQAVLNETLQRDLRALKAELNGSQKSMKESESASKPASEVANELSSEDLAIGLGKDPLRATETVYSLQEARKKKNSDISKQNLGSNLFLWLLEGDEGPSYHHIILAGLHKLSLEWEIDDLFPDICVAGVVCFNFTLYLHSGAEVCNVDVNITSSNGESGQLAVLCCGRPQTVIWEDKPANASKQLVGSLHLDCKKSDQVKVSLNHHKQSQCKCSCHRRTQP